MKKILFIVVLNLLGYQNFSFSLEVQQVDLIGMEQVIAEWNSYIARQNYSVELKATALYQDFENIFMRFIEPLIRDVGQGKQKDWDLMEPYFFVAKRNGEHEGMMILDCHWQERRLSLAFLCTAPWNLFAPENEQIRGAGSILLEAAKNIAFRQLFFEIELYPKDNSENFYINRGFHEALDSEQFEYLIYRSPILDVKNHDLMQINDYEMPGYDPRESSLNWTLGQFPQ